MYEMLTYVVEFQLLHYQDERLKISMVNWFYLGLQGHLEWEFEQEAHEFLSKTVETKVFSVKFRLSTLERHTWMMVSTLKWLLLS